MKKKTEPNPLPQSISADLQTLSILLVKTEKKKISKPGKPDRYRAVKLKEPFLAVRASIKSNQVVPLGSIYTCGKIFYKCVTACDMLFNKYTLFKNIETTVTEDMFSISSQMTLNLVDEKTLRNVIKSRH